VSSSSQDLRVPPSLTAWRTILAFGVVSLAGDMVYEGMRSVSGPLLASLGASALVVGLVTGAGEAAALVLRLAFGPLADRTGRHWSLAIVGYTMTAVCVPLLAFTPFLGAAGLAVASALIILERTGKAVRSPAKLTLLAHAAGAVGRGRGFGVHKVLDQFGAVAGPAARHDATGDVAAPQQLQRCRRAELLPVQAPFVEELEEVPQVVAIGQRRVRAPARGEHESQKPIHPSHRCASRVDHGDRHDDPLDPVDCNAHAASPTPGTGLPREDSLCPITKKYVGIPVRSETSWPRGVSRRWSSGRTATANRSGPRVRRRRGRRRGRSRPQASWPSRRPVSPSKRCARSGSTPTWIRSPRATALRAGRRTTTVCAWSPTRAVP
jgi:hypothetical protein